MSANKIIQKPDYTNYNLAFEKQKVSDFLSKSGLSISDTFLNEIENGDIIEIYSFPENIQIYSNDEFKKLCSYSPEQMISVPFPQLFWRDQNIHVGLMKRASDICQMSKGTYSWDIDRHELIENLHPRKRTFEIAVKKIAPCFREQENLASAFISTLQVEFIFEWNKDIG